MNKSSTKASEQPYLQVLKKKYAKNDSGASKTKLRQKSVAQIEGEPLTHSVDEKEIVSMEGEVVDRRKVLMLEEEVKRLKENEKKLMEDLVHQQQITKGTLLSLKEAMSKKGESEKAQIQEAVKHEKDKFDVLI